MDKILVVIYVPLLEKKYDVFIPINKKVGSIKKVIISTINEIENNAITNVESLKLYNKEDCRVYNNNIYVKSSGMVNGTNLMLI